MLDKWFENRIKTIMAHNDYSDDMVTVAVCTEKGRWTPCDLIAREYLNNGGGSAKGFLGITRAECIKCYDYMRKVKQELIDKDMVNKKAWNNSGFPLWDNYNF